MAALFDRFTKKRSGPPPVQPAEEKAEAPKAKAAPKKKEEKGEGAKKDTIRHSAKAGQYAHVLKTPHVSEKAAVLAERGVYVFNVPTSANKSEIRKAVETTYGVHVERVRTLRGIGKIIRRGKIRGQRNAWKKALVELRKGETIALIEGV